MEHLSSIEYRAFQSMPETKKQCNDIHCREYIPGKYLQPYVSCYWTMTSGAILEKSILHRVIPDGCVDIIFDLNGRSYKEAAFIVGTMTKPILAELKGRVNYVAIRFLPGSFSHFFDSPVRDFTDRIIPLEIMLGKEGCDLVEQLVLRDHIADKIKLLESYLAKLLKVNSRNDLVFKNALHNILGNRGNIKISDLSKVANSSQRQLRRKFDRWIGVSPKAFCSIIRFQNALQLVKHNAKCSLLSVALDSGYYDQSHFTHEFSSYYGLTPSEFLKSKNL